MQVSSGLSAGMLYFVATSAYLGDKRTAYGRQFQFTLSTFNSSAPTYNVTTDPAGDDVIIRGVHADFSLVASLPQPPGSHITNYAVISRLVCLRRKVLAVWLSMKVEALAFWQPRYKLRPPILL